ncbi:MAG: molybdopterin-dependent oxidoreductase, partial [Rhodospirillales bacterium]|nr:molybdopterin-dependent oxidoreductase [Rhodospirillales bacterium]
DTEKLPDGIEPGIDETFHYNRPPNDYNWPNGCHVAEVEIDPETGAVTVTKYSGIDDNGVVLNPMIVHGQVYGGIAQGLGQALLEDTVYDEGSGQLLTASFMDYGMPRASHIPPMDLDNNEVPCTTNPIGVKGCGEGGACGAPPAIVNAVLDALKPLNIHHIDMPLTPEKVWRTIRDGKNTVVVS